MPTTAPSPPSAAKEAASLKDGTCVAQGFTVPDGSTTLKFPVIGKVTVAKFKKQGAVVAASLLRGVGPALLAATPSTASDQRCCDKCESPKNKVRRQWPERHQAAV